MKQSEQARLGEFPVTWNCRLSVGNGRLSDCMQINLTHAIRKCRPALWSPLFHLQTVRERARQAERNEMLTNSIQVAGGFC